MMTLRLLRHLIREEIGRNFQKGGRTDAYPWHTPDTDVSIFWDPDQEKHIAQVAFTDGSVEQKALNDEAEAQHWAVSIVDQRKRKTFAKVK